MTQTLGFLKKLLDTPGPSGFEAAPARVWREEVQGFADEGRADTHGNSIAVVNPKGGPRLMFAGHADETGLQVTHIDHEGYLYFAGVCCRDSRGPVGQRVRSAGRSTRASSGWPGPGRRSRGRGAGPAPARWDSIRRSRWWWT